jgi:hypothetical protein
MLPVVSREEKDRGLAGGYEPPEVLASEPADTGKFGVAFEDAPDAVIEEVGLYVVDKGE